jgi:hypothetical protein
MTARIAETWRDYVINELIIARSLRCGDLDALALLDYHASFATMN